MSAWGRGRGQFLCVKNIGRNLKNERQEWPAVRRPPRSPDTVASGTPETPGGGEQRAPRPRDSVRQHLPSAATPQTRRRTRRRHRSLTGPLVRDADAPDPESAPAGGRCPGPQDAARWRRAPRGARARRPRRQCPRSSASHGRGGRGATRRQGGARTGTGSTPPRELCRRLSPSAATRLGWGCRTAPPPL